LRECRGNGVKLALVTRNLRVSVDHLCRRFDLYFDSVVTREFFPLKPDPAPVLRIVGEWDIPARDVLMVGDYLHDIECGQRAGTRTCFYQNPGMPFYGQDADITVASMRELAQVVF
jgi:phosphoglycolate phosphatase-like HAD superfamily hydrolase